MGAIVDKELDSGILPEVAKPRGPKKKWIKPECRDLTQAEVDAMADRWPKDPSGKTP